MRLRSLMTRLAASTVLIAAAIGAQAAPSISGRELAVGASDVQQYLDGSFPRTQDALGGLIALTMSHPQLSLPAGERLNLGMDVALATAGGNPAKLGTVKLSSGLRYDAQTQGFHLQQPSVDDFTPANQGGRLDSRTRSLLNAWLSDYAQREPIYKLDPAVAGLLGALQVQSAQVKNGLNAVIAENNSPAVVNLASDEYFKVVKPKLLKAPVVTPVFEDWKNGRYKVISFYAKRARGMMARYAARKGIAHPEKLKRFNAEGYAFEPACSTESTWVFRRRTDDQQH